MNNYSVEESGKMSDTENETPDSGLSELESETSRQSDVKKEDGPVVAFLKELPVLFITAVAIAFVIKWLVVQPFYIPSQSMEPTLVPGDRVLVSKFIYRFVEPKPGDIIVFIAPNDESRDFIKRIVAVENDTVEVKDGKLYVNSKLSKGNYKTMPGDYSNWGPQKIEKGHLFVMGDNRPNSMDGRVFGALPKKNILGKAFMVYWPPTRMKILK